MNTKVFSGIAMLVFCTCAVLAQTPATVPARGARAPARPAAPVRDPHAPGFVQAIELADGAVPPVEADGNFIIGPTHAPAAEMRPLGADAPRGDIYKFTLRSSDSKFYPGIARDTSMGPATNPADAAAITVRPTPWSRTVSVYVPKQYVRGTAAPFMVTCDGDNRAFNVLDHLIPQKKVPLMIVIAIPSGGGDGQGSERGLEYDNLSGKYSDFVETEVLPMVEKTANVKLTTDPEGRAADGHQFRRLVRPDHGVVSS